MSSSFVDFDASFRDDHIGRCPHHPAPLRGICPVSHHLAAAKAMDQIAGVDAITPTAEKLRRLMHYGQLLQSNALHIFHLFHPICSLVSPRRSNGATLSPCLSAIPR